MLVNALSACTGLLRDVALCFGLAAIGIWLDGIANLLFLGRVCAAGASQLDIVSLHLRLMPWTAAGMLLATMLCLEGGALRAAFGRVDMLQWVASLTKAGIMFGAMVAAMMVGLDLAVQSFGFGLRSAVIGSMIGMAGLLTALAAVRLAAGCWSDRRGTGWAVAAAGSGPVR
jgi:hypothetical protein